MIPARVQWASLQEAAQFLKIKKQWKSVSFCLVIGSGLDGLLEMFEIEESIRFQDIPGMPRSTVGHQKGMMHKAMFGDLSLCIFQGRLHRYEGYTASDVVFPIRLARILGAHTLCCTNAAGAIDSQMFKGQLMVFEDHIQLQEGSPLEGENIEELGPRYVDLFAAYDKELRSSLLDAAKQQHIAVHGGVYACVHGPQLETPAEYRYLQRIGAHAVGMSTVPEIIAARHAGMRCLAISVLSDECHEGCIEPVDLEDIFASIQKGSKALQTLLPYVLSAVSEFP